MAQLPKSRNGRRQLRGNNTAGISVDLGDLDQYMDSLADEAVAAARPAAQAAIQVIYDQIKLNAASIKSRSGNLKNAIYQVYSKTESKKGFAVYQASWNYQKAPHGHLVEWGYLQRYKYYRDGEGKVRPMVRPGMEGRSRPQSGGRNLAELQAYYVTLPTPIHVPGKAFVRRAESSFDAAYLAAEDVLVARILAKA